MKQSKRLEKIASFVPRGSRVADIGTDHGYLPVFLVQQGIAPFVLATDIGKGPLKRAESTVAAHSAAARIELRRSDGMKELRPGEAETVTISGMGGPLIIRIMEEGKHMWPSVRRFILSPQSELDKVRAYLFSHNFALVDEAMVCEEGKYYTILVAESGQPKLPDETGLLYGAILLERKDPVLKEYLEQEKNRLIQVLGHLSRQSGERADEARQTTGRRLEQILEVLSGM